MPAAKYNNFIVEQGATFSYLLTWKDVNGDPVNLDGYTARMAIKEDFDAPEVVLLTTENGRISLGGSAGTITLTIPADITVDLEFSSGIYDLELINGDVVTRLLQGSIVFSQEVTT